MRRRHPIGGLGVALATVALWSAAGLPGLVAGLLTLLAWALAPATLAFAVGQVLAVPLLGDAGLAPLVAVEVGLLAVLAGPLTTPDRPARTLAAFVAGTAALWAAAWLVLRAGEPLWAAAATLAIVAATAAYGVHRYERVRLGLVEGGS